jgi:RNA polymerase sigma factor (sigma-70 family)
VEQCTDVELVIDARGGDKDAFGLLAQRYQMMARRFARKIIADEDLAQELVQEAMLQAYLSIDHLHDPSRFKGWLCGIVLNVCRNYLRDQKMNFFSLEAISGGLESQSVPFSLPAAGPQETAEEHELHQTIMDAINTLAPRDRDVTLLFYYDQLSLQEIAGLHGISVSAVKVRLYRARRRLKAKLLSHYPEIIPNKERRKIMIRVTIADVVKHERKDAQNHTQAHYVILLQDETGKRALPIWVGPFEGQSMAMRLKEFPTIRPLTYNFIANLLKAIEARIEQVRIDKLQDDTFYATVRICCGQLVNEVDARPSDALTLAALVGAPVFVTEEVFSRAGIDIPAKLKGTLLERKGTEGILREIAEMQAQTAKYTSQLLTSEEIARAKQDLIATIFKP